MTMLSIRLGNDFMKAKNSNRDENTGQPAEKLMLEESGDNKSESLFGNVDEIIGKYSKSQDTPMRDQSISPKNFHYTLQLQLHSHDHFCYS